jgi:sortase A
VLAILRIPGIALEVPVNYGTDEWVLLRGAGLVEGTALPGSNGNVAIAAHRDTHFRGLKDLSLGDRIELAMLDSTQTYVVTDLSVVEPTDVHVLADTGEPVLTLVTCYPFYFVGHAPQRFIVRAVAATPSI